MKYLKKIAFAATVMATAISTQIASAAPTDFSSQAGKAVIFVYQDEVNAQPQGIALEFDNQFQGVMMKDSYVKMVVDPGEYTLLSRSENLPVLSINADADAVYYVRKDVGLGKHEQTSSLEIVEEAVAKAAINNADQIN